MYSTFSWLLWHVVYRLVPPLRRRAQARLRPLSEIMDIPTVGLTMLVSNRVMQRTSSTFFLATAATFGQSPHGRT